MGTNNNVYLMVGPRGAGKSSYAEKLVEVNPDVVLISRDQILMEMFGSHYISPYTDGHTQAYYRMIQLLEQNLSSRSNRTIILDAWTGTSRERKEMIRILNRLGVTRITALYFITSMELVCKWFWLKPDVKRAIDRSNDKPNAVMFADCTPQIDYELFHKWGTDIDNDGFDEVIRINPATDPLITLT